MKILVLISAFIVFCNVKCLGDEPKLILTSNGHMHHIDVFWIGHNMHYILTVETKNKSGWQEIDEDIKSPFNGLPTIAYLQANKHFNYDYKIGYTEPFKMNKGDIYRFVLKYGKSVDKLNNAIISNAFKY